MTVEGCRHQTTSKSILSRITEPMAQKMLPSPRKETSQEISVHPFAQSHSSFSRHSCSCKVHHPSSFDPSLHRLKEPISRVQWIVISVNLTHQPIHSITTEWTYLNTSLPSLTDWRHGRSVIHTATFSYHSERTRWHWKNSRLQSPGIGEKGDYTIQRSNSLKRIDILAEWIGVWGNFQSGSNRRFDRSLCHSRHLSSHRWNSKYQSSHSPTHSIHPAQTREHFQSNHLLSQWLRGSVW